jgi:hypothetical protein
MQRSRRGDEVGTGRTFPDAALPPFAVDALASARRTVAAHLASEASAGEWLASEIRVRGMKENAAVLAVMEIPEHQQLIAHVYVQRHPDRGKALNDLLAVLN